MTEYFRRGMYKNKFKLESNGQCFLCLNQNDSHFSSIKQESDCVQKSHPSSTHSIECLSIYLKMDKKKVFVEGQSAPSLMSKVEKSDLNVELCKSCYSITRNFNLLYRQLERITMTIESCVKNIHGILVEAEETGKTAAFRMLCSAGVDTSVDLKAKIKIVDALRTEALQNSYSNSCGANPRIKLEKLTLEKAENLKLKLKNRSENNSNYHSPSPKSRNFDLSIENIKIENPPSLMLDDDDTGNYSDVDKIDADIHQENSLLQESKRVTTPPLSIPNYTIDPETGARQCGICSKTFCSSQSYLHHYKSTHLKARYKCHCGKEFNHTTSLRKHHRFAHLHVKYQCSKCQTMFNWRAHLVAHLRKPSCSAPNSGRHKCHLCHKAFGCLSKLKRHVEEVHAGIRKYSCDTCTAKFKSQFSLKRHQIKFHAGK